jgi:microcystin-dependent protein
VGPAGATGPAGTFSGNFTGNATVTGNLTVTGTISGAGLGVPSGTVVAFTGTTAPTGWLLCNGSAVSRTAAATATLFGVIGIAFGGGDGTTTFNLPNYQGMFLRGVDNGFGNDPDSASRTAPSPAGATSPGNTGDEVGSVQAYQVQGHTHAITDPGHTHSPTHGQSFWEGSPTIASTACFNNTSGDCYADGLLTTSTTGITIDSAGGKETRPINAYVNWIIKE